MQLTKREDIHKRLTQNNYNEIMWHLLNLRTNGVEIGGIYFSNVEAIDLLFCTMAKTILTDSDTKNTKAMLEAYLNSAADRIMEREL